MVQIFHRPITLENVEIFGTPIENDAIGAGYNIGDLLNIPSLGGFWQACPHNSPEDLARLYHVAEQYPQSILQYYIEARPFDEEVPYKHRIIGAVEKYKEAQPSDSSVLDICRIVDSEEVLCIHIRCGDKHVEEDFLRLIEHQANLYKQVFLFSGLHLDERFASNTQKKDSFLCTMNRLLTHTNISLVIADPDDHIAMMSTAQNLLVHKGGFSAIGMIVCKGNAYKTKYMDVVNHVWDQKIGTDYTHLHTI